MCIRAGAFAERCEDGLASAGVSEEGEERVQAGRQVVGEVGFSLVVGFRWWVLWEEGEERVRVNVYGTYLCARVHRCDT
jgi:hypothetical protein